ncbi:MAG: hypothetical protein ACLQVA_07380 [Candidatus Brocadiia bacterium]
MNENNSSAVNPPSELKPQSAVRIPQSSVALRIRFLPAAPPGAKVLARFRDPYDRVAVAETIALDRLPPAADAAEPFDEFHFLFLPSGSTNTPYEQQKRGEDWMQAPPGDPFAVQPIDLTLRNDRVLWRPGRALVLGAPDRMDEILTALVHFSFYEGEMRRLEQEIREDWPLVEKDLPLTHQVGAADLKRWPDANRRVRITALRRVRLTRLDLYLSKVPAQLTGNVRKVYAELLLWCPELPDRYIALDDQIEIYEDLYESANDRLSEYAYFRKEFIIEAWIVVILALELAAVVVELVYTMKESAAP